MITPSHPPRGGFWKFHKGSKGKSQKPKFYKEHFIRKSKNQNWNFQRDGRGRGREIQAQKKTMEEVWIFPEGWEGRG